MAVTAVHNESEGWLVLWIEPLGEDRWLKPGESVRIRSDYTGDEVAFSVSFWTDANHDEAGIENVSIHLENGGPYAEVVDAGGQMLECGHQRPKAIDRKWRADLDEMRRRNEAASLTPPRSNNA
jgi:hypothetical protein